MPEVVDDLIGPAVGRAAAVLGGASTAVVLGHVDPDGDALGSALALTAALRAIGVDAVACWGARAEGQAPAPLEPSLAYLPGADRVVDPADLPDRVDVVVACDTAAASRLGTARGILGRTSTTVVVDHHAVGDGFGDIRIVDDRASCTGVLVLRLIDALGVPLTPAVADALYLALLTDTGRFSYASTTPADHRVAARLIEAGADHVRAARAVYESASRGYLGLVAAVASRAVVAADVVASWVTQADLLATGTGEHEPDGLIELLRKVGDVDVTCFLRETRAGTWRSSLRSSGGVDVAAIAQQLGGGGHRMAAGFTATGDPQDVIADVRRRIAATSAPGVTVPVGTRS
jgi:phosphoesterase RecJ-like protein